MSSIVLMSDPTVTTIPVVECGEPLADVREQPELRPDDRRSDPAGNFALLRVGVLNRLLEAQRHLPSGLRLLFIEGYRPPALQRHYFEEYSESLAREHASWSAEQVHRAASRYVSPPEIAPHSAGAAVDLTIIDICGRELDMGTAVNDYSLDEGSGRCYTNADGLAPEARANRSLLAKVLGEAGLVNYPTEWWHWSFGDRYWAMVTGAAHAGYGAIDRE